MAVEKTSSSPYPSQPPKKAVKPKDQRHVWVSYLDNVQLHASLAVMLTLVGLYLYPETSTVARPFFELSGQLESNKFTQGPTDAYYVTTWVVGIIFVRIFAMNLVLKPIARKWLKIQGSGAQRFAEQGWALVSYSSSFLWGFRIVQLLPYFTDLDALYAGYPHFMTKEMKSYYLAELANWISQIFIIHVEKRRKDHWQMLLHHIITIGLVYLSYVNNFTRIGNVIHTLMDFVDIWLLLAKVLRYCGFQNACDFTFFVFFFSWILLRHGLYNYLVYFTWSKLEILVDLPRCTNVVGDVNCLDIGLIHVFYALLIFLQGITILWMYLILRVLYKIMTGSSAEDVRSDSEDEEEEEDGKKQEEESMAPEEELSEDSEEKLRELKEDKE